MIRTRLAVEPDNEPLKVIEGCLQRTVVSRYRRHAVGHGQCALERLERLLPPPPTPTTPGRLSRVAFAIIDSPYGPGPVQGIKDPAAFDHELHWALGFIQDALGMMSAA